jgi:hypothetical protein
MRFINADGISYLGANGDFISYNLYAYCSNNPVMYVDPNGNSIWSWLKKTFGFGVVKSERYELISAQTIIAGYEIGVSSTEVTRGDISKPISMYAVNASEWWKIWEYKIGVQVNIGNGGVALEGNLLLENTLSISADNAKLDLTTGINKNSYTYYADANFGERTNIGLYQHGYIRTIPTAVAVVTCVKVAPAGVGVLAAMAARSELIFAK